MAIAFQDSVEPRLSELAKQMEPQTNKSALLVSIARRAARMDAMELLDWLNEPEGQNCTQDSKKR